MVERHYLTRDDLNAFLTPVSEVVSVPAKPVRPFLTWTGLVGAALIVATLNVPVIWNLSQRSAPLPALAPVLAASTSQLASLPVTESEINHPIVQNDRLQIGALGIDAPTIWKSDYTSKTLLENLRSGVVHLNGTALPGQKGTTVITGHSSYYRWAPGEYKDVFAPLLKAQLGQEIKLTRADTTYTYKITQIYEVTPDRTDVLVSGNDTLLRLITCTPLGSNIRRLIVDATQVSPDPNANQAFTGPRLNANTLIGTR